MTAEHDTGELLRLSRPLVMGILNITPDSFSDGGDFFSTEQAVDRARRMVEEGADLIDLGGESTRPGAAPVSAQEELDRVIPVIERINGELSVPVSVDTSKPEVMRAAVAAGAVLVNDVQALRTPGALDAVSSLGVPVCLMHMRGQPRTMQQAPHYEDVVAEVKAFLRERVAAATAAGIARKNILVDPGFGFGKTLQHNLQLLKRLEEFADMDLPLLVGISRKSMIGVILDGAPVDQRLYGSLAAGVMALDRGAAILRVHDVSATVDAIRVFTAMRDCD